MTTTTRKHEVSADEIAAVQLSDRTQHSNGYITYDALSRDGHTHYTTTLNAQGRCVGCTCPATVRDCIHALAAEFEEQWSSPATAIVGIEITQDLAAHFEDDDRTHGDEYDEDALANGAWAILAAEKAERERKMAEQQAYRDAYPDDFGYCDVA